MSRFWFGASAFVALNLLDVLVTFEAIQAGVGRELNPLMQFLTPNGWAFAKVAIPLLIVLLLAGGRRDPGRIVGFLNMGMGAIVIWNVGWLLGGLT
jgi:hypothetical protein